MTSPSIQLRDPEATGGDLFNLSSTPAVKYNVETELPILQSVLANLNGILPSTSTGEGTTSDPDIKTKTEPQTHTARPPVALLGR